jgi:hypothetical protein
MILLMASGYIPTAMSVSITTGQPALTRMPRDAWSIATSFDNAMLGCLIGRSTRLPMKRS